MADMRVRADAESVFDRNQRREAQISEALKQEAARHDAAVKLSALSVTHLLIKSGQMSASVQKRPRCCVAAK
jgi:hypothetical protein